MEKSNGLKIRNEEGGIGGKGGIWYQGGKIPGVDRSIKEKMWRFAFLLVYFREVLALGMGKGLWYIIVKGVLDSLFRAEEAFLGERRMRFHEGGKDEIGVE